MHFSEDELRAALKRQDPGQQFTQRVMARLSRFGGVTLSLSKGIAEREPTGEILSVSRRILNQAEKQPSVQPPAGIRPPWLSLRRLRPALAGALAMVILLVAGLGYWQHQQNERKRLRELAMAREAERQAIVALRIANDKLNRVFQRVNDSQRTGAKAPVIRKERL